MDDYEQDDDFVVNDDSDQDNYRKSKRKRFFRKNTRSKKFKITRDGYIEDDFIIDDTPIDVSNGLIDNRINPMYDSLLNELRQNIKDETPTLETILSANITKEDKKYCIKLYDQLNDPDTSVSQYYSINELIYNMISKGKQYNKDQVIQLENTETRLKELATPCDNLKNQILKLNADTKTKAVIYGQYTDMLEHEVGSQAYNSLREEIEWSVRLPHNNVHNSIDLSKLTNTNRNQYYIDFMDKMNKKLYSMYHIKLKMLHIINSRSSSDGKIGGNIAITGPPGCGKTQICKAFADVLSIPFEMISVGGMSDASIFKGSDRVWNSASPSIILQILSRIKSSSGVIMFDEIDKLGETPKGKEVQYALLHISDYVHNKEFRDNYLNKYTHDFSKIWFVYCMNTPETLDPALRNRLDIIETVPYSIEDKIVITREYVLKNSLIDVGMKSDSVIINKDALKYLVKSLEEPGIREIEKIIKHIVGKVNMYRSVVLKDGSTGDLDLGYVIPKFKLPLRINSKLIKNLINDM